jgi:NAD(P)-dependent dehydrogenase (short-subunit alcohol dehydrogenase family)
MRAIVTGAARGLGAAIAGRLARDGADVALLDVNADVTATAELLAGEAGDAGGVGDEGGARAGPDAPGRVTVGLVADVSDETAGAAAVDRAVQALGGVDVLVNNAGIGGPDTDVTGTSLAEFRRVLDVNLTGTFLMCRAVAKVMTGQGSGGAIVNMGSVFGQQGVAGGAGYCASKAGVALLTHSLALELAPHGIRVNTIAPGNMATEMHWDELRSRAARSGTTFGEQVEMVRAGIPLGRHGTGGDIAGVVAWLVSPDAGYVTGQTIGVNGGIWLS